MVYQKIQMYFYCIHLFMCLFIIPSQSVFGNFLPNLWQRCLEKPPLIINKCYYQGDRVAKTFKTDL